VRFRGRRTASSRSERSRLIPATTATSKAPTAPLLDAAGKAAKQIPLDASVFGAEARPHLVHETVRAELAAARAGTRGAKSRGLVAGGRAKPWRQKGTGRARQGTTRAPQWTGGGVAFPPAMRDFSFKVNRKERRAALRIALSEHAREGTLAVFAGETFDEPSTKAGASFLATLGKELPLVVVATEAEEAAIKSFRNLPRVAISAPEDLEVVAIVWARTLLVSEKALPVVEARAGGSTR
jgi:large subunit ribosomal protein L4